MNESKNSNIGITKKKYTKKDFFKETGISVDTLQSYGLTNTDLKEILESQDKKDSIVTKLTELVEQNRLSIQQLSKLDNQNNVELSYQTRVQEAIRARKNESEKVSSNSIKTINISDVNEDVFFHFAPKSSMESISQNGLLAQIGDASSITNENEPRVYMSCGIKEILSIKNSFLFKFAQLKICEIPDGYRPYFEYSDYSSTELVSEEAVFEAMEKRMKDEVYFLVDAKEGEDYLDADVRDPRDVPGIAGHNIKPEKLSLIETPNGNSAYDVVKYYLEKSLEKSSEDTIQLIYESVYNMFDYIRQRDEYIKSTNDLGKESFKYIKRENLEIDELCRMIEENERELEEFMKAQKESSMEISL